MLFISGIKHSGKTTAAKNIALHYSLPHLDNDDLILSHLKIDSIRSFYKEKGKECFMREEKAALEEYLKKNINSVISLGGGACDNDELITLCKANGKLIYLSRPEKVLLPCILKHGVPPFLDKNNIELSFHRLYTERDRKYRAVADFVIELGEFKTKEETAEEIIKFLEENNVR